MGMRLRILGIARRILDSHNPGLVQLGGVWLPLPHLLMLPFVQQMGWWQNGLAGAWPSLLCYIAGVAGFYRLTRHLLMPRWAVVATAFYALNPNLLYLATTAMTEPLFLALLIWTTLLTVECLDAVRAGRDAMVARRLLLLGIVYSGGSLYAIRWLDIGRSCLVRGYASARAAARCVAESRSIVCLLYAAGGCGAIELAGLQSALLSRSAGFSAGALLGFRD